MHIYTFKTHTITSEEVEALTREECVEAYAKHRCDRLTLEEFIMHHNEGIIDITNDYITIK